MLHDEKFWRKTTETELPEPISEELRAYMKWRKASKSAAIATMARVSGLSDLWALWTKQYLIAKVAWLAADLDAANQRIADLERIVRVQRAALDDLSGKLSDAIDSIGEAA